MPVSVSQNTLRSSTTDIHFGSLIHLSFNFPWVPSGTPPGNPREPRGSGQFWYFLFLGREGELFSFGNDFDGPQGHTHGTYTRFVQRNIALDQSFLVPFYFIWIYDPVRQAR